MSFSVTPAAKRFLPLLVAVIAFYGFLGVNHAQAAFGISPPFLNADHLVKGATYAQDVYLVQDQPNEDLSIKATIDVPESIRSWVTVDKGTDFTIPKGIKQFKVVVTVHVPESADLGVYKGTINFVSTPSQVGQVTIALGAQLTMNLTVGNEIFEQYAVALIKILDIEEGWNPRVYVKFRNEGNVAERIDGASFELFDQFGGTRLAFAQKSGGMPEIPPFTTKEFTIEFPSDFHIGLGQYWGNVVLYKDSKVIGSQKTVFNALKAGSLANGSFEKLLASLKNNKIPVLGILVLLACIAGYVLIPRKKRRRAQ